MKAINEFLEQKKLAIVGVSRTGKKFSNIVYKNLKEKGYCVYGVNPHVTSIAGDTCYDSFQSLPQKVDGVVIVVPSQQTEKVVKDAISQGILHIWIQQGAESKAAIDFCEKYNINVIHHQCLLMYAEPLSFPHNLHRSLWSVLGKLPK